MGYVIDTTYANTFFRELSPAWLNHVAALNGVEPHRLADPFSYLELGSGLGTSAVVHAGSFPQGRFHAYDFNETHVEAGRSFAARLGVGNVEFHAESFERLLDLGLTPYDFIVMHGVYSWVDTDTRRVLRQIVSRLLAPAGLLYISYNALPGWSHELPLRKLLIELAATADGTAGQKSERAAAVLETLGASGLRYFAANPAAKSAVEAYRRGDGDYLAHEFMNAAWEPFYAVDVADEFESIGMRRVGSATLADNHLPLVLDAKAAEAIARLPSPRQQQLAIDFATNQRFRRDVFVRADSAPAQRSFVDDMIIGCVTDPGEIGSSVRVPRGEITFQQAFVNDVRELMAAGSWRFGDAVASLGSGGQDQAGIARNLLFMVAGGALAPFARVYERPRKAATESRPKRRGFGNLVIERAFAEVAETGRGVVPSLIFGNGVELDAADAQSVIDWVAGDEIAAEPVQRRLAAFTRLGLLA